MKTSSMKISFNDFKREPKELFNKQIKAVENVFSSGHWILGSEVRRFEQEWSKVCATNFVVGVANGLDAIEIGLRALGIGCGDEVITTAVTAYATTLAIQRSGAKPVFADINPDTACIDILSVERCFSKKTKAVIAVHLYGRSAELNKLDSFCRNHGIHLIEDCAQAHLANFMQRPVGSIGKFGAWSFYPTKNLSTIGDAGAISTNDEDLANRALQLRNYGQSDRYHHNFIGLNSRLDELHAAILNVRLSYLKEWTLKRRSIAKRYWKEITNPVFRMLAEPEEFDHHVHHLFVLKCLYQSRERIQNALLARGIDTLIHYPIPNNMQKAIEFHRIDPKGIPIAMEHSDSCLSLPIHPFLTPIEVDKIIYECNELILE